jgi:hypothetical protein
MVFEEWTSDRPIQSERERSAQEGDGDKSQQYNHYPYIVTNSHSMETIIYLTGTQGILHNALHEYPIRQAKNNTPRAKAMYPCVPF